MMKTTYAYTRHIINKGYDEYNKILVSVLILIKSITNKYK